MSDTTLTTPVEPKPRSVSRAIWAILPLILLAGVIVLFVSGGTIAPTTAKLPPIEELSISKVLLPAPDQMIVHVTNSGPQPVTIAQVIIDDAYWTFSVEPNNEIQRLASATIKVPYPWIEGEAHTVSLITSTGAQFIASVPVALETPAIDFKTFLNFALIGLYVGIVPVGLGMMWHPFMRGLKRRTLDAILALTIGLLVFLLIETASDGIGIANRIPGTFRGLILFSAGGLLSYLLIQIISSRKRSKKDEASNRLNVSRLLATGIGLHNLAEGLAVGAAYASGAAALGAFLVIGFILHNVTEGIGIAAPVAEDQPPLKTFLILAGLAGLPAILGAWIGGFIYSDIAAAIFLGVGTGAIVQVIVEVGKMLMRHAQRDNASVTSWRNAIGFTLGLGIMYATALLVAV
jgi:zinc transporter ZupT